MLEKTVAAWEPVYERSDVVMVEGLSLGPAWLYASEINQALARALDADVLVVGRRPAADEGRQDRAGQGAESRPDLTTGIIEDLAETLAITASGYLSGERARVVGCVIRSLPATVPSAAVQLGEERGVGACLRHRTPGGDEARKGIAQHERRAGTALGLLITQRSQVQILPPLPGKTASGSWIPRPFPATCDQPFGHNGQVTGSR